MMSMLGTFYVIHKILGVIGVSIVIGYLSYKGVKQREK